ncbi:MerR family transcriptional regulator [Herbaspirillum huttiense]|jgi:DNA-binding transcriptional MerR regulator|uniref:MerR family transcriptional regulator n=4 Tax=Pseudomonadota TaxID=1224 RepID=UPI00258A177E|nr:MULTISPECIES: MerR family transcriptional regulator [Herbaspirillum]MCP3655581.1 MerR family transcriptional regulator [Herbaspirillum sp.]MCP3945350.1 MerR family transcriptional regulator [Herbaspirillum sp.]MCP4034133.1 MerR family transcriptional regulator [Herbaspirillum sp.]MCP4034442.1 MerR family transcriptional regulator [Herbaspirillum sp.]MCP4555324.1 MerR family transcriptional regulator [Herbaspirillum sp.]
MTNQQAPSSAAPAPETTDLSDLPLLRPGAVARQLGMAVETLRAWEHRYGITSSQHSGGGQRLYSQEDLQRLGWIKTLVDAGHRIGKLATLSPQDLQALAQSLPAEGGGSGSNDRQAGPATRLALVGPWIATKAVGQALAHRQLSVIMAVESLDELDLRQFEGDLLLLESTVLDSDLDQRLEGLRRDGVQVPVLILYRFGSPEMVVRLREAGHRVVRKAVEGIDVEWLCEMIRRMEPAAAQTPGEDEWVPEPRFSESALASVSDQSDRMQCECPRHLAELLTALAGFERYSRQCEDDTTEEAELHRELRIAAGRARLPLEDALQKLARFKGISLT